MRYQYRDGRLHVDGVDLTEIAEAVGTPCYVYSRDAIESRWRAYESGFGARAHQICYSVKANGNLSIIKLLSQLGSGFDIVSGGELERVLAAGATAQDTMFSGVGKSRAEIDRAIEAGVGCINVESRAELERVALAAKRFEQIVGFAIRVNPDVDAETHPYISTGLKQSKFGVPIAEARELYRASAEDRWLKSMGIASHIGSQLVAVDPVIDTVRELVQLAEELRGANIDLHHIDIGGGLGIRYSDENPPDIDVFLDAICAHIPERYAIVVEPGRSLVGEAGLLLTRIEYLKSTDEKNFVIVDAAMNDLIRPALYDAWHEVMPVSEPSADAALINCDIVGPVCESGDWLARGRELHAVPGQLLAVAAVGAYGFVMSSNYNARPHPPEVLVASEGFSVIRTRESVAGMLVNERDCLIS